MTLTLHTLAPKHGARTKSFRIGRGHGSGRGKTAGKGTKGQKSRTGGGKKLKLKGLKQMLLSFPKNRGFQSRYQKSASVQLKRLEAFKDGEIVNLASLRKKGMIKRTDLSAKIVGSGTFGKKLVIEKIGASASAKASIEAAGGSIK
ncbi:50S ribosomal protein L15 [Candidatus Uhrbacteria bacterium]|nr:50S ribosomal protein L15 [Candidatus Uhrbacteria bacterium]